MLLRGWYISSCHFYNVEALSCETHNINMHCQTRKTVMRLLPLVSPEVSEKRKQRRLKHRMFYVKVWLYSGKNLIIKVVILT